MQEASRRRNLAIWVSQASRLTRRSRSVGRGGRRLAGVGSGNRVCGYPSLPSELNLRKHGCEEGENRGGLQYAPPKRVLGSLWAGNHSRVTQSQTRIVKQILSGVDVEGRARLWM